MEQADELMERAISLASMSMGRTSPNPMVGAVIVRDGSIIGEGRHHRAGEPHAEVMAIRSVTGDCRGATMFVSLEPCCVHGRTPPCTDAILKAGIKEVYYATTDSNPNVKGRGHKILEESGVKVHRGPLEQEARFLNRAFFHQITTGRPWVTAKYAMSLDGRIATSGGESQWITSPQARLQAHQLRNISDAILVGRNTAEKDNPSLTTRLENQDCFHPTRILLDSKGRTPLSAKLFDPNLPSETWLACTTEIPASTQRTLEERGISVLSYLRDDLGQIPLAPLMRDLSQRNITTLMVEGGGQVLGSFFSSNMINEIWVFIGARLLGGDKAPGPIGGVGCFSLEQTPRLDIYETQKVGPDMWIKALVC